MRSSSRLLLDGQTLINLEIFQNSSDASEKGTLIKLLNHCITPFGKRLFRKWVCHPLRNIDDINTRLDSIDDLNRVPGFVDEMEVVLRRLPDLERIISRIHSGGCLVKDFISCLESFKIIDGIIEQMGPYMSDFKSSLLNEIGKFKYSTEMNDALAYFDEAFEHQEAIKTGKIQLHPGYDEVFDGQLKEVEQVEKKLEQYRKECEKSINCKIVFKDIGKEVYQMEVSAKVKVPRDWTVMSKTVSVNRYYTSKLSSLITEIVQAKEHCEIAMRGIKLRMYEKFDTHYNDWLRVVQNIAQLDCLFGLAKFRRTLTEPVCRPEFVHSSESVLELEELRHPCLLESYFFAN